MRNLVATILVTFLAVVVASESHADTCDPDDEVECINVTAKRIIDRPDYFGGMFTRPYYIDPYTPPEISQEETQHQCRDRVGSDVEAEAIAAGGACAYAFTITPIPLDEGIALVVCAALILAYTEDRKNEECGYAF